MHPRTLILLVCLLLPAAGGCLAPEESSENGDVDQETPDPEYLPPRTEGSELPDGDYPNFQVRNCNTITAGLVVPRSDVEAVIPEAFEVRSLFSPTTTGISLRIDRCAESLDNETLFGATHSYMALAQVRPTNESWGEGLHMYILDMASDNLEFIHALGEIHLDLVRGDIAIEETPLPDDMFLASIQVEADGWDFQLDYRYIPNMDQSLGHEGFVWYGSGPYHRLHETTAYESRAFSSDGLIIHDGDAELSSILPSPVFPYHTGKWGSERSTLYQYDGAWT